MKLVFSRNENDQIVISDGEGNSFPVEEVPGYEILKISIRDETANFIAEKLEALRVPVPV